MSDSPILREPADFAGSWHVEGGEGPCIVTLAVGRVESANAHRLDDPSGCLARALGRPVAGWRPATDGIDMAGPDRLSVGFFSFGGDGTALLSGTGGASYRLVRSR